MADITIPYLDLGAVNNRFRQEIDEAVDRVLNRGWYLRGEETALFEAEYARYIGVNYAVGCGNGFDAICLILLGYIELGMLAPGDEVIVPANTFIATILAIARCGLSPVLVEPDIDTLQIDPALIERAITPKTRALMLVHLYGRNAYNATIEQICHKYDLLLIEDNAQAHGCEFQGRKTGSLGDAAAHSFYPGKNLGALGDAGAVTTNNADLAAMVRRLGNYGSEQRYVFGSKGINSRIDELQAAVLRVKLGHIDADNMRRRTIARLYVDGLYNTDVKLPSETLERENVYHIFPVFSSRRDALRQKLAQEGIETLIHYPIPPHKQSCFKQWNSMSYPITEWIHTTELSLPISPVLTDSQVERIIDVIKG